MPKYSEEKKQLLEALLKDKIFNEACELLKHERNDLFTMRELAERVGISKGTLYNYFHDKYDVIFFIERRLIIEGGKNVGTIVAMDSDCHTILCTLLKNLYFTYKRYRCIFAATTAARAEITKRGGQIPLNDRPRNIVLDFLRRGAERGELIQEAPEILDQYLLIILGGINLYPYAELKNTVVPESMSDDLVDKLIAWAVDGICLKKNK